jgi:hypothetical protein
MLSKKITRTHTNKKTKKNTQTHKHTKKNTHYSYLIKQEFLNDKIPLTNTPKIDIFKKEFQKRGNWIPYDESTPNKPIDFLYMDGKYIVDKSLWKYNKIISSSVDMASDNHSISDKYKLIENLKNKTNINTKHILNQRFINLYNIYKNPSSLVTYKPLFDKYTVLIFKPIHGIKGQDMQTFDNFNNFKKFVTNLVTRMQHKLKHFNQQEYNKMGIEKRYKTYNIEWVLQEYIINPLLYKQRKFHMRGYFIYYNPEKGHKEGYILNNMTLFTAKDPYKTSDVGNKDIHDTHYKNTMVGISFYNDISDMIGPEKTKDIMNQVVHIFKNVLKVINAKCFEDSKNCFQIFGFDAMITDDFNVKIIETNYMPGSPRIEVLQNIMTEIVDPLFKPKIKPEMQENTQDFIPYHFIKL